MSDATRRTVRTTLAALLALAAMAPVLVREAGLDPGRWPWLATVLAACAALTRIMAAPQVEVFLQTYVPWLAKQAPDGRHELGRAEDAPVDAGWTRVALTVCMALAVIASLCFVLLAADRAHAHPGPDYRRLAGTTMAITSARVCEGVLTVEYIEIVRGRAVDLGQPLVEVRGYGAWAHGESWQALERFPGTHSPVRVSVDNVPYWHGVRIVLPGSEGQVTSWPALEESCAA
jgi:hypothetical protein